MMKCLASIKLKTGYLNALKLQPVLSVWELVGVCAVVRD